MATIDVTVRGAGIFGLSIAWECVQRGARVRVVDPTGVGAGSSGGVVGALAPHVPENWNDKKAFQFDSLRMSQSFWSGVEAVSGLSTGYRRTGRLQPLVDDHAVSLARQRADGATSLWEGFADWVVCPVQDFEGWAPPSPSGWLVHDTLTARMHPRRTCAALAAALKQRGVEIVTAAPDQGAVVWATGWQGLLELNQSRTRMMGNGIKGQAALLKLDVPLDAPQLFADTIHIVPHADGTVAIGSTSEREFTDPSDTDAQLDDILTRARAAVPQLKDAPVIERWAGVRPRSRSRAPMLGHHPDRPDQFIANGGFKIGFGMAPKVAMVMADLMLDADSSGIPQGFAPAASV